MDARRRLDPAPDFALPDQDGHIHRLADYAGRWLVLYFYPKDDTPACTVEACSFRDAHEELVGLNAAVVGISKDDADAHTQFRRNHALNLSLIHI